VSLPQPSVILGDQLCFSLYRASKAITARYRPMLEQMGITYPQLLVLMTLWENDDQTVREISDNVDLDGGTISPMLKRLAAIGLITRERSTEDERLVRIRLTDAGRALEQPACGVSGNIIDALALDTARFAALKQELDELAERISSRT
jgi:DNA-binding MarR family transcriptional regulator